MLTGKSNLSMHYDLATMGTSSYFDFVKSCQPWHFGFHNLATFVFFHNMCSLNDWHSSPKVLYIQENFLKFSHDIEVNDLVLACILSTKIHLN